ncbi:MAG TPA: hypothetical protein ENH24_01185 [Nitrospirae bacterium]|nr:hypothetical protein [Nitrospirota bacterium]
MAGAFTHFMICQKALKGASPHVKRLVRGASSNLYIGAVSSDIPYLAIPQEKTSSFSCADYMHYYKTNGIPQAAVSSIRDSYGETSKIDKSKFAWTLGYISHVIIDAVIHPIVEAVVGPYQHNKSEHMLCEMVQDAFVFKEITGREIDGSFIESNMSDIDPGVLVFWRDLFFETYFPGIFRVLERNRRRTSPRPQQTIRDIRGRRFRVDYLRNSIRPARCHRRFKMYH